MLMIVGDVKKWLERNSVRVNLSQNFFKESLRWACKNNHCNVVEVMLNHGADPDERLSHGGMFSQSCFYCYNVARLWVRSQ